MKWPAIALGLSGLVFGIISSLQTHSSTTVIITGDINGYLAPCGCSSPMTGGITRQASLIRQLGRTSNIVLLVNGALSGGTSKQEQFKTETLAETFGALNATAINLSPEDARLGLGTVQAIQNLSNDKLISSSIQTIPAVPISTSASSGSLLVGGISVHPDNLARPLGTRVVSTDEAVKKLLDEAKQGGEKLVLLLDGNLEDARSLARGYPDIKLIVYRLTADAPSQPERMGETLLVSPGQFGKSVIRLTFDENSFSEYSAVSLVPDYKDDPQIQRFYDAYLKRVDQAGFIDRIPRQTSQAFAGTATCGKCHAKDMKTWEKSKHSIAFKDLESKKHARDPDCVGCHVVGLTLSGGFRSRAVTPNLASVGCESCHGAGASHSKAPRTIKMPKASTATCIRCHTHDQSPNFNIKKYWTLIEHH